MKTELKSFMQRIRKESPKYFKYIDDAKELQNRPEDAVKFLKDNKGKFFVHIDASLYVNRKIGIYVFMSKYILIYRKIYLNSYKHFYIYTCKFAYKCMNIHVCIIVYMFTCTYITYM
jgi:hypothetical protein